MIYLASPYSHPDSAVRERRFCDACRTAAALIKAGHIVYSPIVHSHPLASFGLPIDWQFWEPQAKALLAHCDELFVLTLDGWWESIGVAAEIQIARESGISIRYIGPKDAPADIALANVAKEARS